MSGVASKSGTLGHVMGGFVGCDVMLWAGSDLGSREDPILALWSLEFLLGGIGGEA